MLKISKKLIKFISDNSLQLVIGKLLNPQLISEFDDQIRYFDIQKENKWAFWACVSFANENKC